MYIIRETEIQRTLPYCREDESLGKVVLHTERRVDTIGELIELLHTLDKIALARGWELLDRKQGDALYRIPGPYLSSYSYMVTGPR